MRHTLNNAGPVVSDDEGGWICGLCVDSHASYRGAVQCRRDAKHAELKEGGNKQKVPAGSHTEPSTRIARGTTRPLQQTLNGFGFVSAVKLGAGLMLGAALMYLALIFVALLLGVLLGISVIQLLALPT